MYILIIQWKKIHLYKNLQLLIYFARIQILFIENIYDIGSVWYIYRHKKNIL